MRDGREFNITYLKGFDILSMFKDAVVDCKFSSLMIRVESDEASFYCVSKELFNQLLNEHSELVEYVNSYYRKKLSETISRQELMTMNGKNGAVCAFIYYFMQEGLNGVDDSNTSYGRFGKPDAAVRIVPEAGVFGKRCQTGCFLVSRQRAADKGACKPEAGVVLV